MDAIGDDVFEGVNPGEAEIWRVGDRTIGTGRSSPVRGLREAIDGESVEVEVGVIVQNSDVDCCALGCRAAVVDGYWWIEPTAGFDCHCHDGSIDRPAVIADFIGEGVNPGKLGVRRVGDGVVRFNHGDSVCRWHGDIVHGQRVSVGIGVVGQDSDAYRAARSR